MKVLCLCLVVALFSAPLWARQGGEPAPEKCVLEGEVVKGATGEPLGKAQVLLQKAEARAQTVTMLTDSSGRFVFTDIEPGRYRLSVRRNGYVPQRYGQRGPQHPGTVLSLAPGQRLLDIVFRLIPHGVITGRVYDETGEPLPGVRVQVQRSLYVRGERQLIPTRASETNDLGEYRIYGLAPGRYYVSATYEAPAAPTQIWPERGRELGTPAEGYAATFYLGTNDPMLASPIDLSAGEEISRVDFSLLPARTVRVRGHVLNSVAERPAEGTQVFLVPRVLAFRALAFRRQAEVRNPDGSFEIGGVTPGSYDLVALYVDGDRRYSTRLPVEVGHSDIEGITLVISAGVLVAGRIYIDGAAPLGRAPQPSVGVSGQEQLQMTGLHVLLQPYDDRPVLGGTSPAQVEPSGAFRVENVPREMHRVNVIGLPEDYYLKSGRVGGEDMLEKGLDLRGGIPTRELELVVSSAGGRIDGAVVAENQQTFSGASVVLIPEERRRADRRFYKTVTTDQYGRFTLRGIPPGDYELFAWEEVEPGAYQDSAFLRLYEGLGTEVGVQEGVRLSVQLRLIPGQE